MSNDDLISVGEIAGAFGIKGWVKVFSYTDPRENILNYSPWLIKKDNELQEVKLIKGKQQGKSIVASLESFSDRNIAESYVGWDILVKKSLLPKSGNGDYYWADLVGLQVETESGTCLGKVDYLIETGANDVLVVNDGNEERLIPFLHEQVIKSIELDNHLIIVDWDPNF